MPSRRVELKAFEDFLRAKHLPRADSLNRSAEGGLPLDPNEVEVVVAQPIREIGRVASANVAAGRGTNGHGGALGSDAATHDGSAES